MSLPRTNAWTPPRIGHDERYLAFSFRLDTTHSLSRRLVKSVPVLGCRRPQFRCMSCAESTKNASAGIVDPKPASSTSGVRTITRMCRPGQRGVDEDVPGNARIMQIGHETISEVVDLFEGVRYFNQPDRGGRSSDRSDPVSIDLRAVQHRINPAARSTLWSGFGVAVSSR